MDFIKRVKDTIKKYQMVENGDRILVGLSGGPDSVCLLTVLNRIRQENDIDIFASYIDHGLRPEETPHEIKFCKELCSSLGVEFMTRSIDVKSYVLQKGINKQEAARELRYSALLEIASELKANKIALGHNSDDQAETVLLRLFRGSGSSGLSGIPPVRVHKTVEKKQALNIIRPLIEMQRHEIEDYLRKENIGFVIDSSNLRQDYLRNKIRLFFIPEIKKINKDFIVTISKTADILREEDRYFEIIATKSLMRLISSKNDSSIELFLTPLESMDTVIIRRVLRRAIGETRGLRRIGFVHIEDIINLIKSGRSGDRIYLPNGIRAIKGYSTFIITSEKPHKLSTYIMDGEKEIVLKEASMVILSSIINISELSEDIYSFKEKSHELKTKNLELIDIDKIKFPLIIRSRLPGDYFYPLGFGKKKKLQDFFVDEKIPRDERDIVPILTCNNNIVLVIGHRLDDRYKVDKDTKRVLQLEIKKLKS